MTRLRTFLFRLRALIRARQMDREIDDEIASHLAEAAEEYVRQGLSPEQARSAARRLFGGVTQPEEMSREVRSVTWVEDLARDARYALRALRRTRAFTIAAAATLALVIGANTTMFSVLNAVLLRPLPYQSPEQLAMLWTEDPTQNLREARSALWNVEQWRSQSRSFADMAVFDAMSTTVTGREGAEQIIGASMSPNMLSLLGVKPVEGRSFSNEEIEQQQQRQVLISHRFWQTRFGGSREAIGATLVLNSAPSQIIGVLPADFRIGRLNADVWTPRAMSEGGRPRPTVPGPETWSVIAR